MSTTTRRPSRRRKNLAILVIAILVSLALVGGLLASHGMLPWQSLKTRDIGENIKVEANKLKPDLKAQISKANVLPEEMSAPSAMWYRKLTPLLEITPSGELPAKMRVTIPLSEPADKDTTIVVMTRPSGPDGKWERLEPIGLKPGDKTVTVEMAHLSFLEIVKVLYNAVVDFVKGALLDGIGSGAFSQGQQPKCKSEDTAREDGYSIKSDDSDTVYWCFGKDNGRRSLHVVNNRRYPLEISWSKLEVPDPSMFTLSLLDLYKRRGHLLIEPREKAVFFVKDLKEGDNATLSTQLSNWGLTVGALQNVAEALMTAVIKVNPSKFAKVTKTANEMWSNRGCADDFAEVTSGIPAIGKALAKCFSEGALSEIFGQAVAIPFSAISTAFQALDTARAILNAIGDRRNNRDRYQATIARKRNPFSGIWQRKDGSVTFKGNTALLRLFKGYPCDASGKPCSTYIHVKFEVNGDTAAGMVDDDWSSYDATPSKRISRSPNSYDETIGKPYVFKIVNGVLWAYMDSGIASFGDMDGDGAIDDENRFCNAQTPLMRRARCNT